jgi:hypothetical protein
MKKYRAHAIDWDRFDILIIVPGDDLVSRNTVAHLGFHPILRGHSHSRPKGQVAKGDLTHIETEVVHEAINGDKDF